jgi:uncharacterized protein YlaI
MSERKKVEIVLECDFCKHVFNSPLKTSYTCPNCKREINKETRKERYKNG